MNRLYPLSLILVAAAGLEAQQTAEAPAGYVLGFEDQIQVWVSDVEELNGKQARIDTEGYVSLPVVGRLRAGGLRVQELQADLARRLTVYVQRPQVSVAVIEYRPRMIFVAGAVRSPGSHRIRERTTLVEALTLAGGSQPEAADKVTIARRLEWGRLPLASAADDATGRFSVGEVVMKEGLETARPEENIILQPEDRLTVPKGDVVYVLGEVSKPGGYVLGGRVAVTALQLLLQAGGPTRNANAGKARLLRGSGGGSQRSETVVDVNRLMRGKAPDFALQPGDALLVPGRSGKWLALRTLEAALSVGTGWAIYRF